MIGASCEPDAARAVLAVLTPHAACGVCLADLLGISFVAFCEVVGPLRVASRVVEGPAGFFRLANAGDGGDLAPESGNRKAHGLVSG